MEWMLNQVQRRLSDGFVQMNEIRNEKIICCYYQNEFRILLIEDSST